jgi:8-oxo-dGTP pyrophosphatase MutT (NUDIX family)
MLLDHARNLVNGYIASWGHQQNLLSGSYLEHDTSIGDLFNDFLNSPAAHFHRDCFSGHFTGSALVTDTTLSKVLLTHHKKLNLWLQLGGHADGESNLATVAMTEASEESGLTRLAFAPYEEHFYNQRLTASPLPFDMDRHLIPESKREPAHYHYDIRFLVVAHESDPIAISQESHDLRWFTVSEAKQVTQEESMLRQFFKLQQIQKLIATPS